MEVGGQMEAKEGKLKEDLSRQEGAYGAKMIGKLKKMKCAVFGLRGVGVEVAKNLLLAGPHTVVVHDDNKPEPADLGTNFYISLEDMKKGKTRAEACEKALSEINPNTYFRIHSGEVTSEVLSEFHVVVFTDDTPLAKLKEYNAFCRKNGIKFVYVGVFGMLMSIFSDFGENHEIFDTNGDAERSVVVDKVEVVSEPYKNMQELLKLVGGMSDEAIAKLGYSGKKKACCDLLKDKAGYSLDEKRQKSITPNEILELADTKSETKKKSTCGKITTVGQRHLLSDGDFIKFDEITMSAGQAEASEGKAVFKITDKIKTLNSTCEIKTHRTNASVFYIGDISGLGDYQGGGVGTQVKMPVHKSYQSLADQVLAPSFEPAFADMSHFGDELKAHLAWVALQKFRTEKKRLPLLHDEKDSQLCVELAKKTETNFPVSDADDFVAKVAQFARAETNALCALAGGIVAQEAMKQTGKYTPIGQWIHLHAMQMLKLDKASKPVGSRYDHYISLFGEKFAEKAQKAKFFLVGCGALGCEFLKNIAMTGLGCSEEGAVHITDDDVIELSNLSRQFLFRRRHVGKLKSESAAASAVEMNPELKKGLKVHNTRVEPKTESEFTDKFWQGLDFVVNALDNLKARNYVDTKCLIFSKPLFESGTLGTQANQTIHVPFKTPSYKEGAPPGEGQGIAMCTLTNFPYEPLHCIEWSRTMFGEVFEDGPSAFEDLRRSGVDKYLEKTGKNVSEEHETLIKTLKWVKIAADPTLEQCVRLAMDHFLGYFRDDVKNLIHAFPEDARNVDKKTKEDKGPFWHGRRRFPRAHELDTKNEDHAEFVYRTTCIFADIFGLTKSGGYPERSKVVAMAAEMPITKWVPKKMDVVVDEDATKQDTKKTLATDEYEEIERMRAEVKAIDTEKLVQLFPADFEKDDDTNHHIDWITSASNLRGWTRKLKASTRQHCRMVAGRIIAAIATATAAITGLVFLEIYKLLLETEDINDHRWSTLNLATNVFAIELPPDPKYTRTREEKVTVAQDDEVSTIVNKVTCIPDKFTSYEFIEMKMGKDMNLVEFVEEFKKQKGLEITMLSSNEPNKRGGVMYQEINVGFYQGRIKQSEMMASRIRNPMQRKRFEEIIVSSKAMVDQAELQKNQTVLEAWIKAYGPLADPDREFLVLSASVNPTDRELEDQETIEIPAIKYYFK